MLGFDTLRGPWRLRPELVIAVLVVASFEALARFQLNRGQWVVGDSLAGVVQSFQQSLAKERPRIWLAGNSTLSCGTDRAALESMVGEPVAILVHASCTLRASAAMLDFYMRHAPRQPEKVVVTVTIDDLHSSGYRSQISHTYLDINFNDSPPSAPSVLAMRAARGSILKAAWSRIRIRDWLDTPSISVESHFLKRSAQGSSWNGDEIDDSDPTYQQLDEGFQMDSDSIRELAALRKRRGIVCTLLLLPVTGQMQRYHDRHNPSLKYAQLRQQLAQLCREHTLPFVDWGEPSAEISLFKDPYHLGVLGREVMTKRIGHLLGGR